MLDNTVTALIPVTKAPPDVTVYLPGQPIAKAAGRAAILKANPAKGRWSDRAMVFQDKETRSWQAQLKFAGENAMAGRMPFDCALRCRVTAVFQIPTSKSQRWKADARVGLIRHSIKPDDDNLLKARDALKGIVFVDDSRFCESVVRKFWGDHPGYRIEIWKFVPALL